MRIRQVLGVASVLALAWSSAMPLAADTYVRRLPAAPAASAHFKRVQHKVIVGGQPVTLISVLTGMGDWDRPDDRQLQTDRTRLPSSLQGRFQRFYGGVVGWMLVPAGWRLLSAAIGADGGSSYSFVAPGGAARGWLIYGATPACVACMLGAADGLLPGAWQREVAMGYAHGARPWQPIPAPGRLDHPNDCTALLRYRSGGLTVHGVLLSTTPMAQAGRDGEDVSLVETYAALPASQSALGRAIVASLRANYPACAGRAGAWNFAG